MVFASDFSVRGYQDSGFGTDLSWDIPLLEGYQYFILKQDSNDSPHHFFDLHAPGLFYLLRKINPSAVLLTSFSYKFDIIAYFSSLRIGLPVWLRMETQDKAFPRHLFKAALRSLIYRFLYIPVDRGLYIGQLNKQHYLAHGLKEHQLSPAHYCTLNPIQTLVSDDKQAIRDKIRNNLQVSKEKKIVAFFGKFIDKKDPLLLLKSLSYLSSDVLNNIELVFVGSGALNSQLKELASDFSTSLNIRSHFPGFINQSELHNWYLASDLVVLPSQQMGETWGLVINEALQAGCSVIISSAVGCQADFNRLERVRIIPVGNAKSLAKEIEVLISFPRDFSWADNFLQNYSIESAAQAIAESIDTLT
ncbi:glycosyltransferase [Acaryochloris marina NIES-2412]|uniref:glycosyltransferase n=1 Tax=Acaryochloris marina TaxID=155978 RepID=UPI00405A3597